MLAIEQYTRRILKDFHPIVAANRPPVDIAHDPDRKSTRLNSSHLVISYAVFCLKTEISGAREFYPRFAAAFNDTSEQIALAVLHHDSIEYRSPSFSNISDSLLIVAEGKTPRAMA